MSSNVAVVYATTHGHTEKIAEAIAEAMRGAGVRAETIDVREIAEFDLERFDAAVVGASVHGGRHQRVLVNWAERHTEWLTEHPSTFFSVCLTAAEDTEEAREVTADYLRQFEQETGWKPSRSETFAGALQYREYDPFTRILMRLMMRHEGHPSDASRDYDYTDWAAVERFGVEFAEWLRASPA